MKLFTFIFSLYLLLLTGIPCCAFDNCEEDQPVTERSHKSEKAPVKGKGCDNCSPFFSCHSCCTGFIVQDRLFLHQVEPAYADKDFSVYRYSYQPEYISSFWQPPQA